MIFLWTDVIFWILLIIFIIFVFSDKPKNIENAWKEIARSRMGVSSAVILVFYFLIAFLDSVHFKTSAGHEVYSLLDMILTPLLISNEKTYTAPFSVLLSRTSSDLTLNMIVLRAAGQAIAVAGILTGCLFVFTRKMTRRRTLLVTFFISCFFMGLMLFLSQYYHIMGTDKVGQDVFYQAIKSIRTGIIIGSLTTLLMFPFALIFGTLAGYFRGWVDDLVQYVYTTLSSIPSVLLIVALMLMLEIIMSRYPDVFDNIMMRADFRLLALCVIFGVTSWTSLCRLVRAETLKLREQDYVKAGIVLGSSHLSILKRHIVPNLMHIVLITMAMEFSSLVLAEAILSYVGVGVDSSTFSWGNMINSARLELARDPVVWWSLASAFTLMFGLVLSANLFADVVQKAFNPRARSHADV